ncbi:ATP-binding protein, partial [Streptomyces sp. UNOC14_S4]|uniref:ATP-binding protein n=1 Tax=Streptomyces sp. UNOC14_S4 TaxID=2872340 RepID=UPI001E456B4F
LPHPRQDHYLGLDANAMGTKAVMATEALVKKSIRRRAPVCVHGHVGLGKTFAVHAALRKHAPDTTRRLSFHEAPNMSVIRGTLWRALAIPGEPPASIDPCDHQIRKTLAGDFHVLLLDEAQLLSRTALEYFRALWDDNDTQLTIVFVGSGNTRQKILNCAALHSRIYGWYQFSPLTPKEVLDNIPIYHRTWVGVDPDLILWTDDRACHGAFRTWARLTAHLQDAFEDNPGLALDKDLIRWAFSHLDSTTR